MLNSTVQLYKNSYGGLSANTWWLSLVMFINRSGTMVVPFMSMYLTLHVGVSIAKAGFVMSLFGIGAIVGALLGGKLTDKIGFFYVQLVTLGGGGVMFILLGLMKSYTAICIFTFLLSMVNDAFRPANSVAIAQYSKAENRTRSYSLNRLAINLGWAFGGALGGLIAGYNYQLLFWVDGITNLFAAVLMYVIFWKTRSVAVPVKKHDKQVSINSAYKDKTYLWFIAIVIVFAFCFFQIFTTVPVYYKVELHLSEAFIGITMALNGLIIALIEMLLVFKLEGRRPALQYITGGTFLIAGSYFILNVPVVPAALIALASTVLVTFGEMFSMPFMNSYWVARTTADNRGQYAALYTIAWSFAQAVGPYAGAQVAEHGGYNMLWWMIGTACCLACFAFALLRRRTRQFVPK